MGLNVAIVGLSRSTHDDAPWSDPTWEKWGLPWDDGYWLWCNRLFEMHALELIESVPCRKPGYIDLLNSVEVPLYMQDEYKEIQRSKRYPFEDVSKVTGDYFNSSIAYMLALAIYEKADKIGLWGVDMAADEEYFYQRPNIEYLLGLARGKGIEIYIPEESPILKFHGEGIKFGDSFPTYKGRYGWL